MRFTSFQKWVWPQWCGSQVSLKWFGPQRCSSKVFLKWFGPQGCGSQVSLKWFGPQWCSSKVFLKWVWPQWCGSQVFLKWFGPQRCISKVFLKWFGPQGCGSQALPHKMSGLSVMQQSDPVYSVLLLYSWSISTICSPHSTFTLQQTMSLVRSAKHLGQNISLMGWSFFLLGIVLNQSLDSHKKCQAFFSKSVMWCSIDDLC